MKSLSEIRSSLKRQTVRWMLQPSFSSPTQNLMKNRPDVAWEIISLKELLPHLFHSQHLKFLPSVQRLAYSQKLKEYIIIFILVLIAVFAIIWVIIDVTVTNEDVSQAVNYVRVLINSLLISLATTIFYLVNKIRKSLAIKIIFLKLQVTKTQFQRQQNVQKHQNYLQQDE